MLFDALAELLGVERFLADQHRGAVADVGRLRILLADDSHVNQQVGQRLLERLGCRADIVSDGDEAVRACAAVAYDVVLMDVQMPTLDGVGATTVIRRELPAERQPWIVALTAAVGAEDRRRCLAAGMNDFLPKPVRLDTLAETLARAPSSHGLEVAGPGAEPDVDRAAAGVLDREALDELAAVGGDGFLAELVSTYRRDAGQLLATIRSAAAGGARDDVRAAAHALRGAAAMLGAVALPRLCAELERSAADATDGELDAAVTGTAAAHERFVAELERLGVG
jgi:CheY-like chemotaxis protein